MPTPQLDKSLLYLLNDLFLLANDLPQANGDAAAVVHVLRTVRPQASAFVVAEALQLQNEAGRRTARLLLAEAEMRFPADPLVKAGLALTLFGQKDSLWQVYAEEVRSLPPHPQALAIVASIEKVVRNDPAEAKDSIEPQVPAELGTAYLPYLQMGVPC
jgi:Bacterial type III secretion protein (HrpB1_HrpK)